MTTHHSSLNSRRLVGACLAVIVPLTPLTPNVSAAVQLAEAQRPDVVIDAQVRARTIDTLARRIEADYPLTDVGARTAAELRRRLRSGAYDGDVSAQVFAEKLIRELRTLTKDEHFFVEYFVVPRPFPEPTVGGPGLQPTELEEARTNYGLERVERLPGNVGYLKINRMGPPQGAGRAISAAMHFLARSDALIIDLRDSGGGFAGSFAFLASYLVDGQVQMSELRSRDQMKQIWTAAYVPGDRYLGRPVYVLTSARKTFSAAEGFAYDLQAVKRLKVVGEVTRGGANPVARVLLSERFMALIPTGVSRNPVTGTNWNGVGIQPDIRADASRVLEVAHLEAIRALVSEHPDDSLSPELNRARQDLEARLADRPGS